MSSNSHPTAEQAGKNDDSSAVAEALEEWVASAKLSEVVAADRKAFGPVTTETRRRAEQEW
ncbi:hypothetical protein ACFTWH_12170 [Streptomyces sp. NPDC057011]|uniref:hypothetical protein n=1 Tax=unclassified Streptomyces TaxID=2593676 RepID=UPI00363E2D43